MESLVVTRRCDPRGGCSADPPRDSSKVKLANGNPSSSDTEFAEISSSSVSSSCKAARSELWCRASGAVRLRRDRSRVEALPWGKSNGAEGVARGCAEVNIGRTRRGVSRRRD